MASYFNSGSATDTALLHSSVRTHTELANVATRAEADVLRRYTLGDTSSGRDVYLQGYAADADSADTALREQLRQTIAEVVSHRLRYYDEDPTLISVSRGARSETRAGGTALDLDWPRGWNRRLYDFDTRNPFWGV